MWNTVDVKYGRLFLRLKAWSVPDVLAIGAVAEKPVFGSLRIKIYLAGRRVELYVDLHNTVIPF